MKKSTLEPSVRKMLELGKDMGSDTAWSAHCDYMRHYDCFFLIDRFTEQQKVFNRQLYDIGIFVDADEPPAIYKWVDDVDGAEELTVDKALEMLTEWENKDEQSE